MNVMEPNQRKAGKAACMVVCVRGASWQGRQQPLRRQLYNNDRSEIIWTDADLTLIKATCSVDDSFW